MSNKHNKFEDYDDEEYRVGYINQVSEHRKMKRMRNAIRSKNIDDLMRDLDDDYDEY